MTVPIIEQIADNSLSMFISYSVKGSFSRHLNTNVNQLCCSSLEYIHTTKLKSRLHCIHSSWIDQKL